MSYCETVSAYERRYRKIYDWFNIHKNAKTTLCAVYKFLPYPIALSYICLIVYSMVAGNTFSTAKLIITPAASFVIVSLFRKCIDSPRPYTKYSITPLVQKDKKGESMPSRHVFSITMIAMCWMYVLPAVGFVMLGLCVLMAVVRVLSGVHFVKDVVAGFLCGIFFAIAGLWVL